MWAMAAGVYAVVRYKHHCGGRATCSRGIGSGGQTKATGTERSLSLVLGAARSRVEDYTTKGARVLPMSFLGRLVEQSSA